MRVGRLRDRIELQTRVIGSRDSFGGEVVSYTSVSELWAELEPYQLSQRLQQRRQSGEVVLGFRVRMITGVSLSDRIVFDGENFTIIEIDPSRKYERELLLIARAEDATH